MSGRSVAHFAFGLWVFAAITGFAFLFAPEGARTADIVRHAMPPNSSEFYLAHDRGGHVDHHVLYHGIDRVAMDRLRNAEVVFLGNSRLMFALDQGTLRRFFGEQRRSYYVLGFGHEEQDQFPVEIMRANGLRPRLVVVNADHFFGADRSDWAARVVEESDFDAWKVRTEAEAAHAVRRALHRVVPHYVDLHTGQREFVIYRSREDGTWFVANEFGIGSRFDWPPGDSERPTPESLRAAESFKREVEARGARLVLCIIPAPDASLHRAQAVAAHLGVPLLVPQLEGLRVVDGSHLSTDSAQRVSAMLVEQLRAVLP